MHAIVLTQGGNPESSSIMFGLAKDPAMGLFVSGNFFLSYPAFSVFFLERYSVQSAVAMPPETESSALIAG